jgi:hypothetical protein
MAKIPITVRKLVPSYSVIELEAEKDLYWNALVRDWGLAEGIRHFPGSHPVSINQENLSFFSNHSDNIMVSLKSDGVRHIMYMTLRHGTTDQPMCILIDRARNMYEIEVWGESSFFENGTILDGELLWKLPNEDMLTFLIFDVIRVRGTFMTCQPYDVRLNTIYKLLQSDMDASDDEIENIIMENKTIIARNNINGLRFEMKQFLPAHMTQKLWDERSQQYYRNDGIIFVKSDEGYCLGTATNHTYKWKPQQSIDVRIDAKGFIWANHNNNDKNVKITKVNNKNITVISNKMEYSFSDIVECEIKFVDDTFELFPIRKRSDKLAANTRKTIESTCAGIQCWVSLSDITSALGV